MIAEPDFTPSRFRIYYADDVVEGKTAKDWNAAPDGVQVVIYYSKHGPSLAHGVDHYAFPGGGTKNGKLIGTRKYEAIRKRAYSEA